MAQNGGYPTVGYRSSAAKAASGFQSARPVPHHVAAQIARGNRPRAQLTVVEPGSRTQPGTVKAAKSAAGTLGKRIVPRLVPGVGWVMLALDIGAIGYKLYQHYTQPYELPEAYGQDGYQYPADSWTYCSTGSGSLVAQFPVSPPGYQECNYVAQGQLSTTGNKWIQDFGPSVTGDPTLNPGEFIWKANEYEFIFNAPFWTSHLRHHQRVVRTSIPDDPELGEGLVPMPRVNPVPDYISPDIRKPGEAPNQKPPRWKEVPRRNRPGTPRETGPAPRPRGNKDPARRPTLEIRPDGKVRRSQAPHTRRPPRKNEKEKKVRGLIQQGSFLDIALGTITEGADLLYAIYDALPDEAKYGTKNGWTSRVIRRPPPQEAIIRIYENLDKLDVSAAAENYLTNWFEDQLIGRANKAVGGFAGRSMGAGITVGPAI